MNALKHNKNMPNCIYSNTAQGNWHYFIVLLTLGTGGFTFLFVISRAEKLSSKRTTY